jgi:hypothetical protein
MSEKEAKRSETKSIEDQLSRQAGFVFAMKGSFILFDIRERRSIELESESYNNACEEALKIMGRPE